MTDKRAGISFLPFLLCIGLCMGIAHAGDVQMGEVTTEVKLRRSPGLNGQWMETLAAGQKVIITQETNDWYQVVYEKERYGYKGWAYKKYVKITENAAPETAFPLERSIATGPTPGVAAKSALEAEEEDPLVQQSLQEILSVVKTLQTDTKTSAEPAINSADSIGRYSGLSVLIGSVAVLISVVLSCLVLLYARRRIKMEKEIVNTAGQVEALRHTIENIYKNPDDAKEKREHTRVPGLVRVEFVLANQAYLGVIKDISVGGAFIETKKRFSVGQNLVMNYPFQAIQGYIRMNAVIIRTEPDGIAVRFKEAGVKLFKERNKEGEVVSATVAVNRDGVVEKRRFDSEGEAKTFIRSLK
ncbi:PilZ domain-containing protein [Desulfosudis oleivorans]|uniref:Type IV pilus assembly PilZ n=1 Tax=Desulfosudis oleivorans (strain DSM 6200 / JCM 39069 / Hxd3) TaxID=96561 RepID=A8ZVV3_DESOH|nr:PilZ domain-containing protein [Desulfosudis oleivorans]ABW66662.1 type IV pilus assembly PilZ [Desulfosudis oleivorans Hxd3]